MDNVRSLARHLIRYAEEGRWVTLTGPDGSATSRVRINSKGQITAGPRSLEGSNIKDVDKNVPKKDRLASTFKALAKANKGKKKGPPPPPKKKPKIPTRDELRQLSEKQIRKIDRTLPRNPKTSQGKELRQAVDDEINRRLQLPPTVRNVSPEKAVDALELPLLKDQGERKKMRETLRSVLDGKPQAVRVTYKPMGRSRGKKREMVPGASPAEHAGIITNVRQSKKGDVILTMQDYSRPDDGKPWSWTTLRAEGITMLDQKKGKDDMLPAARAISQRTEKGLRDVEERERADVKDLGSSIARELRQRAERAKRMRMAGL